MGVSLRGVLFALVVILSAARSSSAAALEPIFPDSTFRGITLGKSFTTTAAAQAGFQPAQSIPAEQSSSGQAVLRFERAGPGGRVDFFEMSATNRLVVASGWSRTASETEAADVLADWCRRFGFPDDVIAESGVRGVGWKDVAASLRLELVLQPGAGDKGDWELSGVLRRPR